MARTPRKYAVPLVVTFAVMSPACSGKITGPEGEGSGGTRGDGDLGSGGGAGSNPPGWGDTDGSDTGGSDTGGSGGLIDTGCGPGVSCNPPELEPCDLDELVWSTDCPYVPECFVRVDCTGGEPRQFLMECHENDGFYEWKTKDDSSCSHSAEECSHPLNDGVRFRCDTDSWRFWMADQNLNPPAPCPFEKPAEGADCVGGDGFGSDPTHCAYRCDNEEWTVMGCSGTEWKSDGACSLGAGGSAGGTPE